MAHEVIKPDGIISHHHSAEAFLYIRSPPPSRMFMQPEHSSELDQPLPQLIHNHHKAQLCTSSTIKITVGVVIPSSETMH
jgi:hypothetical protein